VRRGDTGGVGGTGACGECRVQYRPGASRQAGIRGQNWCKVEIKNRDPENPCPDRGFCSGRALRSTMAITDPLQTLLLGYLSDWRTQLQTWAVSGALVDAASKALVLEKVPTSLKDLNSRLAAGEWSDIPRIELLSGSGMGGAIGAWAESTQTIYLNSDWLSGAIQEQVNEVLTEESGHYLDSQFNKKDTGGDEGKSFGRGFSWERGLSSQTVETISGSSPEADLRGKTTAGSILDTQSYLFTTRDFSSAISNSSQPIMRCGCSNCIQQSSGHDKDFKANKWADFPPNNVVTLNPSLTWSALPNNNPYINGLMTGSKWGNTDPDSNRLVTLDYYFFDDEFIPDGAFGYPLYQEEEVAAINAMNAYSSVANISFTKTLDVSQANIAWASLDSRDSGSGVLGYAYTPESGNFSGITTVNADNYLDSSGVIEGSIDPGSYYYITFTHELGHALGLKHPHDTDFPYNVYPGVSGSGDGGDNGLNAGPWTVMTYNDSTANNGFSPTTNSYSGFLTGLGAFDIAAVQYLYGANLKANTGNTTYRLSDRDGITCIWDNGGIDVIDASDLSKSVKIDLRNATLQNSPGGGGYISRINNEFKGYTIAYNSTGSCIIENATGSSAADTLTGNSVNNILNGGAGKDTLTGSTGVDRFIYRSITHSRVGSANRDVITDFKGSLGEKIDLSVIDAYTKTAGNQAFVYIGSKAFTGTRGEVRFSGGILQMNTGTDKIADMEIALTGVTSFSQNFLIL